MVASMGKGHSAQRPMTGRSTPNSFLLWSERLHAHSLVSPWLRTLRSTSQQRFPSVMKAHCAWSTYFLAVNTVATANRHISSSLHLVLYSGNKDMALSLAFIQARRYVAG